MSTESESLPQQLAREAGACTVEDVLLARCEEAVCFYPEQLAQFYASIQPEWLQYDEATDVLTIHGVKYTRHLFESMSMAEPGRWLRITERQDGVLAVGTVDEETERKLDHVGGFAKSYSQKTCNQDLMSAVEAILNDGHMNTEQLARLRAAWENS